MDYWQEHPRGLPQVQSGTVCSLDEPRGERLQPAVEMKVCPERHRRGDVGGKGSLCKCRRISATGVGKEVSNFNRPGTDSELEKERG